MEKNQIFIKSGTEYKKITKELLEESNLEELIGDKDKMVGIKPNMVSASDPSNGATTHTEIIAGILEYLKEHGFRRSDDPRGFLGRRPYFRCIRSMWLSASSVRTMM